MENESPTNPINSAADMANAVGNRNDSGNKRSQFRHGCGYKFLVGVALCFSLTGFGVAVGTNVTINSKFIYCIKS